MTLQTHLKALESLKNQVSSSIIKANKIHLQFTFGKLFKKRLMKCVSYKTHDKNRLSKSQFGFQFKMYIDSNYQTWILLESKRSVGKVIRHHVRSCLHWVDTKQRSSKNNIRSKEQETKVNIVK